MNHQRTGGTHADQRSLSYLVYENSTIATDGKNNTHSKFCLAGGWNSPKPFGLPNRIAGKIPGKAKLLSFIQRLSRFLANPAINVRTWYEPIARRWLASQAGHLQQVRLIVDGTKVGFAHQLLIVNLAFRKRAIPIA